MKYLGLYEGKAKFSEVIEAARRGETIVITRRGVPVAKITSVEPPAERSAAVARLLGNSDSLGVPIRDAIAQGRH